MNVIHLLARIVALVSTTENTTHVTVRTGLRAKIVNCWWTGVAVVEAYHNPVKMEQHANKCRTCTSVFANPVGRARCVTWKWCPVMTRLYAKEFDVMLCAIMAEFVKISVIVIGAIVPMVILVATAQKKLTNVIRPHVKMELHVGI